jgi:F-type H+-transporting ATPase subunit epsilon
MVIMRCVTEDMGTRSAVGDIGILSGHIPLQAVLGISPLRILDESFDDGQNIMAVYGGVVTVRDDVVTIMTEMALWPDEIDQTMAEKAREEAERKAELHGDSDIRNNQINLRRALVQIEVSSYPLVGRK